MDKSLEQVRFIIDWANTMDNAALRNKAIKLEKTIKEELSEIIKQIR